MKKLLMALLLTAGVAQASGDKFGVGVEFNGGVGVAVQYDQYKGSITTSGTITVDYLMYKGDIDAVKGLSWYAGPGAYVNFAPLVGVRVVGGLDYNINDQVDVYTEIAPALNVIGGITFGVGYGLGVRYFF